MPLVPRGALARLTLCREICSVLALMTRFNAEVSALPRSARSWKTIILFAEVSTRRANWCGAKPV